MQEDSQIYYRVFLHCRWVRLEIGMWMNREQVASRRFWVKLEVSDEEVGGFGQSSGIGWVLDGIPVRKASEKSIIKKNKCEWNAIQGKLTFTFVAILGKWTANSGILIWILINWKLLFRLWEINLELSGNGQRNFYPRKYWFGFCCIMRVGD